MVLNKKESLFFLRSPITLVIIGVVAYAIGQTAFSTVFRKHQLAEALSLAAAETNKQMKDKRLDAVTVFKNAWYTSSNILNYSYTITDSSAAKAFYGEAVTAQRQALLKNYCTEMRALVESGARVRYWYHRETGTVLRNILLSPNDCPISK